MSDTPERKANDPRSAGSQAMTPGSRAVDTSRAADSTPVATGPFSNLPTQFGRYRIEQLLDKGAMGAVYLAHDMQLDRPVALKVARVSTTGSARLIQRMEMEAKAAGKIDHPLICKVYDFGEIEGIHFIALQYIEGEDLKSYLKRVGKRLEPTEAISLTLQIARALKAAHEKDVIHRDLKPENVMLNQNGEPVIMDFGLARRMTGASKAGLTQGMILGTAAYMSPEQAVGKAEGIDHRSDLYALGVMLFEMLTGEWPFSGSSIEVMGRKCVQEAPSPLKLDADIPPQLAAVCHKMIAQKKEDRYADCDELIAALESVNLNASQLDEHEVEFDVITTPTDAASDKSDSFDGLADFPAGEKSTKRKNECNTKDERKKKKVTTKSIPKVLEALVAWWNERTLVQRRTILSVGGVIAIICVAIPFFSGSVPPIQNAPPAPLNAPFNGPEAKAAQQLWAKALGRNAVETNSVGMELALIPPGTFEMGSRLTSAQLAAKFAKWGAKQAQFLNDQPAHRVSISQPFYVGRHEVTVRQFRNFVDEDGYRTESEADGKGGWGWTTGVKEDWKQDPAFSWKNPGFPQEDNHPVVNVTWNDAKKFCEWLTRREGHTYRLLTEAEWEHACKAGTTTLWYNGDDPESVANVGNIADATFKAQHPISPAIVARDGYAFTAPGGQFQPNAFGLFDMHGNVWEWCEDEYDPSPHVGRAPLSVDPLQKNGSTYRICRGGSLDNEPESTRSSHHNWFLHNNGGSCLGFRVARAAIVAELPAHSTTDKTTSAKQKVSTNPASAPPVIPTNAAESPAPSVAVSKTNTIATTPDTRLALAKQQYDSGREKAKEAVLARYRELIAAPMEKPIIVKIENETNFFNTNGIMFPREEMTIAFCLYGETLKKLGDTLTEAYSEVIAADTKAGNPLQADILRRELAAYSLPTTLISLKQSQGDGYTVHADYKGFLWPATNIQWRMNGTFEIVNGLSDSSHVSIRSANLPNHYFNHGDLRILVSPFQDNDAYRQNATFKRVSGLSSPTGVSFESVNFPDHFIRGRNEELWLDKNDRSDRFRQESTFLITAPLFKLWEGQNVATLMNTPVSLVQGDAPEKNDAPESLNSPFSDSQARAAQRALAKSMQRSVVIQNSVGMEMVLIPRGQFVMGSPDSEMLRSSDENQHTVTLTKPFYMGVYEVTQSQYERVMDTNPSSNKGGKDKKIRVTNNPVENVTWNEAVEFCLRLSKMSREQMAGRMYRLPTESEWECACRAGTTTAFNFGNAESELSAYAWCSKNTGGRTQAVGKKPPNAFGLFDMHGNVDEWCQDRFGQYSTAAVTDPLGPSTGNARVYRGGYCGIVSPSHYRSACRSSAPMDYRSNWIGFRVAVDIAGVNKP